MAATLPSGTVTFLFTDIEGSTELWDRFPDEMAGVIGRHDELVRGAIEEAGGYVFKSVGDGLFSAFVAGPPAVDAALRAQRALTREPWRVPEPLRVRMAVHSGQAQPRGGDYFGPPLNRVSRILSAGHGDQILLSKTVEPEVRHHLPDDVELEDLGMRRLKDLVEPEHLYQVVSADLRRDFPPLRTLDARPHNLPAQATSLVGREKEIAEVRALLTGGARLVTLTGPSGAGKTRLALQVAADLIDNYDDGVFLSELSELWEPELLPETILGALGHKAEGEEASLDALTSYLSEREMLLVLDNFEQLVDAAPTVSTMLGAARGLSVLVTSQAPLRLRGEHEFPVPPLSLPDSDDFSNIERLSSFEAVELFTERAHAVTPAFELNRDNAGAVVEIVRQLDGLPLAIELAAARSKLFPPRAMVDRLQSRFDFLTAGSRDLPDRQRTLRGAIAWSYELLDEDEQALFRRLSVFSGGWDLSAAETVCADDSPNMDVLEGLSSLIDKSLVRPIHAESGEPRFALLTTIRAFGAEKLEEAADTDTWRRRHAEYFSELAGEFNPASPGPGEDLPAAARNLNANYENLRTAVEWAIDAGDSHLAVSLSVALPAVWMLVGKLDEGQRWLERILDAPGPLDEADQALGLNLLGRLGQIQGDNSPRVIDLFEQSLALYQELGDLSGAARALMNLGNVQSRKRAYSEACALFLESLEIYRQIDEPFGITGALMNLGDLARLEGEDERATRLFEEARDVARERDAPVSLAYALQYLATMAHLSGDLGGAARGFAESLALFEQFGARIPIAWSWYYQGGVALDTGEVEKASQLFEDALTSFEEMKHTPGIACVLLGMALLIAKRGDVGRACRLLGAAESWSDRASAARTPVEAAAVSRLVAICGEALGPERFAVARDQGHAMTLDEAIAMAREGSG